MAKPQIGVIFFLGNTVVVSILCFWTSRSRWDELSVIWIWHYFWDRHSSFYDMLPSWHTQDVKITFLTVLFSFLSVWSAHLLWIINEEAKLGNIEFNMQSLSFSTRSSYSNYSSNRTNFVCLQIIKLFRL